MKYLCEIHPTFLFFTISQLINEGSALDFMLKYHQLREDDFFDWNKKAQEFLEHNLLVHFLVNKLGFSTADKGNNKID